MRDATLDGERRARAELTRGSSVGRYLLLDRVGEGGMGVVYKAYDPELDRPVALKLLPGHSAGQSERLLREAQALAQLSHPNVIAVHDVGLFAGDVFIAMEYVDGTSLRRWLEKEPRTWHEIVALFLAAGEGLEAAHRAALVHRDFKPDNVIVGRDGRVRVLDFGLARTIQARAPTDTPQPTPAHALAEESTVGDTPSAKSAGTPNGDTPAVSATGLDPGRVTANLLGSSLTRAGAVVGTPRFMAPEQHLGRPVDERADQFSFCVSLYWALYRSFPFAGDDEDLDALLQGRIATAPPHSPVPRWLREVLLRGLSPEPAARYASMTELLAALRADPALARRRRLRTAGAILGVAAVVSAFVAGTLAYRERREAREQARLGRVFAQEVAQISALSRIAALLPLHDLRPELDIIRTRMERLRAQMDELGPLAVGPGHEALGRGYLALERYDEALAELDRAWASGYRSNDLAWALGMVHGKLYQRALAALRKTGDDKADAARLAEIARAHRDPALRYLKEAGAHEAGVEAPEYVEGLIALYEQRFDDAEELAQKAYRRVPWLFEARTLEGDIRLMSARALEWKGDVDGAARDLERAGAAYRAAIAVARSAAAAYLGDCQRLVERSNLEVERDRSPAATVQAALAACADAATARPDDAAPVAARATAWQYLGNYQARHGSNPTQAEQQAIGLGQAALRIDARDSGAELTIAAASLAIAERLLQEGGDPRPTLAQAIDHAERALRLGAGSPADYALLCHIYYTRGAFEETRGDDPRGSYRAAVAQAALACARAPDSFPAWNALGNANLALGGWEAAHGFDPAGALDQAVAAYRKVVRITPTLDHGFINLCGSYANWAQYELWRGLDPRAHLTQAAESCEQAIRINGNYSGTHLNLGETYKLLATWQLEHDVDPTATLARSRAALERALAIDAAHAELLVPLGQAHVLGGRWAAAGGGDPTTELAAAEAAGKRALAVSDGQSADALELLADTHRWRAEWLARRGGAAAGEVRAGLALTERALASNPRLALAAATEGALHLIAARATPNAGERATEAARARAAFDKALAIDGNLERDCRPLHAEAARLALH